MAIKVHVVKKVLMAIKVQ